MAAEIEQNFSSLPELIKGKGGVFEVAVNGELLFSKKKLDRFPEDGEVVELIRKSGKSVGAVAMELDLTEPAVRRWVQQAEIDLGRGPEGALMTAEREEVAQLRKQVKTLEMEREILKKATAFFVKESK